MSPETLPILFKPALPLGAPPQNVVLKLKTVPLPLAKLPCALLEFTRSSELVAILRKKICTENPIEGRFEVKCFEADQCIYTCCPEP